MFSSPGLFWWAAGFIYAGFAALIMDILCESDIHKWFRRGGLLLLIGLALVFSFGIVFYKAPIQIIATSYGGKYKSGELVYGILWDDGMSDLRVDMNNPSERDYNHLDLTIVTVKAFIRDQKQITNIPGVILIPMAHELHFKFLDKSGETKEEKNYSNVAHDGLRVLCDRLPKKSGISLILATSTMNPAVPIDRNGIYIVTWDFAPPFPIWIKARASNIKISGTYSVWNRPFADEITYQVDQQ